MCGLSPPHLTQQQSEKNKDITCHICQCYLNNLHKKYIMVHLGPPAGAGTPHNGLVGDSAGERRQIYSREFTS